MPMLTPEQVPGLVARGASGRVDVDVPPRFAPGDRVRARNLHPLGHTRLPRYVRGRRGTVERDHGVFAFPDAVAHGRGPRPQHVYSVSFSAEELWGADAPWGRRGGSLHIDLFDDYLEPA